MSEDRPDAPSSLAAARFVAEFARVTWLGLSQVARESGGYLAAFSLTAGRRTVDESVASAEAVVSAEALVVTGGGRQYRYRDQVWPSPHGASVQIAASRFVTAIEERIRSLAGHSPAQQLAAARQAAECLRQAAAADPATGEPRLAAALLRLADQLRRHQRGEQALAAATEAATIYRELADRRPEKYAAALDHALTGQASLLAQLSRAGAADAPEE